ncbi:hypothetical protein SLU01_19430 [Sporosarcina luteola]|uniref:Tape measure protein N-terminal domain-containing protein n=1 Tax=Sporosarcina luteola TaxID=582850 RepID=A0A511Z856_9BACL|nr:tape measure protein [Sporosarcina luteola]GEN83631.1 hypothetical protein SLU01_19430 [Sporosarcina luteola]
MNQKSYEIAFRLGAKMDSSLRTAFASANKNMNQLNRNSGTLTRTTGTLTRTMGSLTGAVGSVAPAVGNMTRSVSRNVASGIIAPFQSAIGMVKQYAGALGLLSGGALAASGMNRLSAIENAQTSLTVMMGDAKKAKVFLDEVLAFAKTTPFAFPDLAETARNLIAFGMDAKKVVPTMQAIGDAAAASGKGSEGLRQIASAFGAMQVSGTLSLGEINRLMDAGIPALKIMANQTGTSVDKLKKQISKGMFESGQAIDMLVKGMQEGTKGIAGETAAMSGIMEQTKKNWTGSVDSLKSSISSTMATIMEPAKPHIQAAMAWFGKTFSKLPPVVFKAVEMAKPAFSGIVKAAKTTGKAISGIFNTFKGGAGTIKGILSFRSMGLSKEQTDTVIKLIQTVKQNFKLAFSQIAEYAPIVFTSIRNVFSKVGPFVSKAADGFKAYSDKVREISTLVAPYIKAGLSAVIGVVKDVVGRIAEFWNENGAEIIQAVKNVAKVIGGFFKFLAPVVLFIVKMIWENVKGVIRGGLNIILGLVKIFSSLFTGNWKGLWEGVKRLLGGAIEFLWNLWNLLMMGRLVKGVATVVKSIIGFFKGLGPKLATNVQYYYHLFMDKFYQIGIGILRTIASSIGKIVGVARNAVTNFITVFQTARTFGVNIFMSIVSAVRNLFSNVFGYISNIISTVVSGTVSRISGFITSVKGFILTLQTNIYSIFMNLQTVMATPFNYLKTIVQNVVSGATGLVKGLFDGVTAAGRGAINGLVAAANAMIGGVNKLSFKVPDWVPLIGGESFGFNLSKIPMLAKGGITTGPTLAMIGEGAEQEAVLPLSKLNALHNPQKGNGNSSNQYVYSPSYHFHGSTSKEEVEKVDSDSKRDFNRLIREKEEDNDRLSFA